MTYQLSRTRPDDGVGDSGGMSLALWVTDGEVKNEADARPRVGVCIRVGSLYARSYHSQDWWQTSFITRILSDEPKKVVFETGNSEYVWRIS